MKRLFTLLSIGCLGAAAIAAPNTSMENQKKAVVDNVSNMFSTKKTEKAEVTRATVNSMLKAARQSTKAGEWTSIGKGYYRECLMSAIFRGVEQQDIEVEMESMEDAYGTVYRLINPYANWENPFIDVEYDEFGDYDMYIHVVKVNGIDYIWIEDNYFTGLYAESMGDMYLITQRGGYTESGISVTYPDGTQESFDAGSPELIEFFLEENPGCYGTLNPETGIMTYPETMVGYTTDPDTGEEKVQNYTNFLVGFSDIDGYYGGNSKKAPFAVTLPGFEPPAPVDPFDDAYVYIGEGTIYNNIMTPILQEQPDAPYSVGIYYDEGNPYDFHIRNAWGEWHDASTKDADFEIYFPYLGQGWYLECGLIPDQETGYDDFELGEIDIVGRSYFENSAGMPFDEIVDQYPSYCVSLDIAAKKMTFGKECVLYFLPSVDENSYLLADASYQFEGYLEFPADYTFPDPGTANPGASVGKISSEDVNAPVKYYNLQGVEITNPAKGQIVIMKQGSKTSKYVAR